MNSKDFLRQLTCALAGSLIVMGCCNITNAAESDGARFVDRRITNALPGVPVSADSAKQIMAVLDQNRPHCPMGKTTNELESEYKNKISNLSSMLEKIAPDAVIPSLLDIALTNTELDNQSMELIVNLLDARGTEEADESLRTIYDHADVIAERMMMQRIDIFVTSSLADRVRLRRQVNIEASELDQLFAGNLARDRVLEIYAAAHSQGLVDDEALLHAVNTRQKLVQSFVIRSSLGDRSEVFRNELKVHEGKTDIAATAYRERWLVRH